MGAEAGIRRMQRSSALSTGDLASGALARNQITQFITLAQGRVSPFFRRLLARFIEVREQSGNLPRHGVSSRIMRPTVDTVDSGSATKPVTSNLAYALTDVHVMMDLGDKAVKRTINPELFVRETVGKLALQWGIDLEDLAWNGDASLAVGSADYDFLSINTGFVALIEASGTVIDGSAINAGDISEETFFEALEQLPDRYIQIEDGAVDAARSNYSWVMSKTLWTKWARYAAQRADVVGAEAFKASVGKLDAPGGIPVAVCPKFPSDRLGLLSPDYMAPVRSESMALLTTNEGRENIRRRITSYAMHGDVDFVLVENAANVIVNNLN